MENVNTSSFTPENVYSSVGNNNMYNGMSNNFNDKTWTISGGTILRYFAIIVILSISFLFVLAIISIL